MAIPEHIEDKLDHNPSWTIQHIDIVRLMDETQMDKPWSRYMIQQNLDGDPSKGTVDTRLGELVELDVIDHYEYSNYALYDLSYDPMIADGGRLRNANVMDLNTYLNDGIIHDLSRAAMLFSLFFIGLGAGISIVSAGVGVDIDGSYFFEVGIVMYIVMFSLFFFRSLDLPWVGKSE